MKRTIFFIGILSFGCVLMFLLYKEQIQTERASTLAPFYQILGKPIRTMNRALTKIPNNAVQPEAGKIQR
uniref:Lipoprotein n=1 Tax=Leptospira ellisii TaxID=2023197 RepID=A0A2N0B8P2_9LEPT|nr:hypothetical protein CH379_10545 [Leptospira ellisii]